MAPNTAVVAVVAGSAVVANNLPLDGEIEIDDVTYDIADVYPDLRIDPGNIADQLAEQSALYARWGQLSEEAAILHDKSKRQRDLVVAELDEDIRRQARKDGEKTTEALIKNRILMEPDYQAAEDMVEDRRRAASYTKLIQRALEMRLQGLIAINNRDRAEMHMSGGGE